MIRSLSRRVPVEIRSSLLLIGCAALALLWANLGSSYDGFWSTELVSTFQLRDVVNEVLMCLFFLLVSLEIKHELVSGHLSKGRQAALPVAAALGGMILPALIYLAFNRHQAFEKGWGIPMATDIAFTLGALKLLGRRVPSAILVFVSALAIADDLGAVLVIAIFYNKQLDVPVLLLASIVTLLLYVQSRRLPSVVYSTLLVAVLWWLIRTTGMHATLAGVITGFVLPYHPERRDRTLAVLRAPVNLLILPLFAIANAGVAFQFGGSAFAGRVFLGVSLGLIVGKPLGISLFSLAAVKTRFAALSGGITWRQLVGASVLCGIGFTMSLFIADLALAESDAAFSSAKLAILAGSLVSGILGSLLLHRTHART